MPGTSQPLRCSMSASVKHPQPPQLPRHPQPPSSAATHNSARPDLLDQAELGRLYKPACSSLRKDTTIRSRRDNFSGSNFSFNCSQRFHRDYFSGLPCRALNKNWHMTDPDTPGKWFRPPAQGHKRTRTSSPPSPRRPRKCPSASGRWCK